MKQQVKVIVIIIAVAAALLLFGREQQQPEQSLQYVLSTVEGVGDVFLYYEQKEQQSFFSTQQVTESGVLVVCEGCHSQRVKLIIVDTVSAVLNIPPHQIKVLPLMEEER